MVAEQKREKMLPAYKKPSEPAGRPFKVFGLSRGGKWTRGGSLLQITEARGHDDRLTNGISAPQDIQPFQLDETLPCIQIIVLKSCILFSYILIIFSVNVKYTYFKISCAKSQFRIFPNVICTIEC